METVLETKNITMKFGGLVAVDNFSMKLGKSDLVGIIGPNGAGKTTIFNMITGIYKPTEGDILLANENIVGKHVALITQKGIARTFQNIRLFKDLTVLDNIRIAGHYRTDYGLMANILRTKKFHQEEKRLKAEAIELLKIFKLDGKLNHLAKNLPYGEQRRLEIARALATKPDVLLLDEPAAGMNPNETADLTKLIRWVRDEFKIAILLIEHDMRLVMEVCERIYVVDHGELIAKGNPEEVQKNPKVIEAYLGTQDEKEGKE
ncbi:MAG: ABC transporter ATP-binding protein [Bacteriovoracaceae bacterium]|jgi:branched-chain amino acid transport system ATP-binding protein|nr:ABC transporter ATP-binding protein [Bacteriovoracaceae bacterium]